MIRCTVKGDFKKTTSFLNRIRKLDFDSVLSKYGAEGVKALSQATPVRTGLTAASWDYEIVHENGSVRLFWTNSNVDNGVCIAVILDYGHATASGGYVQGRHFISPAIQPVFDKIAEAAWKEVVK